MRKRSDQGFDFYFCSFHKKFFVINLFARTRRLPEILAENRKVVNPSSSECQHFLLTPRSFETNWEQRSGMNCSRSALSPHIYRHSARFSQKCLYSYRTFRGSKWMQGARIQKISFPARWSFHDPLLCSWESVKAYRYLPESGGKFSMRLVYSLLDLKKCFRSTQTSEMIIHPVDSSLCGNNDFFHVFKLFFDLFLERPFY